jgi:Domain of unknown function (DUF5655)/Domain of unknown function (DUF4287)
MNIVDKAIQTQLTNIQAKTGQTLDQLHAVLQRSGLTKHAEIRAMFQRDLGLGYGDANMLTRALRESDAEGTTGVQAATPDNPADRLYTGAKAALRPIHDRLMTEIEQLGAFEIAPKKSYLSLRRKKQFAMVGPTTNTRVEVGLNMKDVAATARLVALPPGGMCQYNINLTDAAGVDAELLAWIKQAYESAG